MSPLTERLIQQESDLYAIRRVLAAARMLAARPWLCTDEQQIPRVTEIRTLLARTGPLHARDIARQLRLPPRPLMSQLPDLCTGYDSPLCQLTEQCATTGSRGRHSLGALYAVRKGGWTA
jgi:hypothetical protein